MNNRNPPRFNPALYCLPINRHICETKLNSGRLAGQGKGLIYYRSIVPSWLAFSFVSFYTSSDVWLQHQGHPTSIFGKYLFGKRFEIQNFRNICSKICCLPTSPRIFERLQNGIIAHFLRTFTLKRSPRIFGSLFSGRNFRKGKLGNSYNFRITRLSAGT